MPRRVEKAKPKPSRPRIPGYGIPKTAKGMLAWSFIEERMSKARHYWLATTRPDGRPHARPVDGIWMNGVLSFGGGPEIRWVKNLHANPAVSVHLDRGDEVVILEGAVEWITDPTHPLAEGALRASKEKYPEYYPGEGTPPFRPFWIFRPDVVFAWTLKEFPKSATRFLLRD